MKAVWNNTVIAESPDTVLVEGNHYFPESSLKREFTTFPKSGWPCTPRRRQRRNEHGRGLVLCRPQARG